MALADGIVLQHSQDGNMDKEHGEKAQDSEDALSVLVTAPGWLLCPAGGDALEVKVLF